MSKTLMIAATLLSLGVGTAFADGEVYAPPAQVSRPHAAVQTKDHGRLFQANTRPTVSVYPLFNNGGYAQGGQN